MSDSEQALVPIEQKEVLFYDDEITAVRVSQRERAQVYVPVRPLAEVMGLDWSGQLRRLRNDPVLSDEVVTIRVVTAGGPQEMPCLPLDMLNGWLFGINANRVKETVRPRVIRYQRDCYRVLYDAFEEGRLSTTATSDTFEELLQQSRSEAVEAYRMLQAMIRLARNQIMLEAHLETQDLRLEHHEGRLDEHETRLEQVELALGDPRHAITPEQASQISQAVKAVAHELGQRTGRNEYGGVYGELYRRYSINSYKELPKNKFDDALSWLNEWLQSLIQDSPF
ncbi:MAG: phage antirepressor N-terminal domain-containing protein [Candidatus Promineifilaceae bacterium]|nr:phage antirepressor N-terminal domain-containing protein [Candidatus Promineifilaceae bacterium]